MSRKRRQENQPWHCRGCAQNQRNCVTFKGKVFEQGTKILLERHQSKYCLIVCLGKRKENRQVP